VYRLPEPEETAFGLHTMILAVHGERFLGVKRRRERSVSTVITTNTAETCCLCGVNVRYCLAVAKQRLPLIWATAAAHQRPVCVCVQNTCSVIQQGCRTGCSTTRPMVRAPNGMTAVRLGTERKRATRNVANTSLR